MFISKAPVRISFFGGSTDYKDFYSQHGSLLIGTTIDKFAFTGLRYRPMFLDRQTYVAYSNYDIVDDVEHINNPLIRETLKYFNIFQYIDLITFNDIPSRTGLGGSSSFCVSLIHSIYRLLNKKVDTNTIVDQAIDIERNVLKDSGGIQDQIWAGYGGFNSIVIEKSGKYLVKPLPISTEFISEFKQSLTLIYTNIQRDTNDIAKSHENTDKTNLLSIANEGLNCFTNEDIQGIGKLIRASWEEKKSISNLISTNEIDKTINNVISCGAYGAKLLGSGGCGFVCVVGPPNVINKINHMYRDRVLNFKFDTSGPQTVLS